MEQKQSIYLSIQDHTGDRKLKLDWNPKDGTATKHIEEMFVDLQAAGYRFFSVKKVMGVFKRKGEEVKTYDPSLGELIYELDKTFIKEKGDSPIAKQNINGSTNDNVDQDTKETSVRMFEVEEEGQKQKYEDPKKYDPKKEGLDSSRDYIATKPLRAG